MRQRRHSTLFVGLLVEGIEDAWGLEMLGQHL